MVSKKSGYSFVLVLVVISYTFSSYAAFLKSEPNKLNEKLNAKDILALAFTAMGGKDVLSGIHNVKFDLRTVNYRIDDSERSEGPYWLNVVSGPEWRDEDSSRYRAEALDASAQWTLPKITIDDGRVLANAFTYRGKQSWTGQHTLGEHLAFSPEKLLFTAEAAADLIRVKDEILWNSPQYVLTFTWKGFPVRLYVDQALHLPTRLETTRAYNTDRLSTMLGDIDWRTDFIFYRRQDNQLIYPLQWNTYRDGAAYSTTVVVDMKQNTAPPKEGYNIPAGAGLNIDKIVNTVYNDLPVPKPAQGEELEPIAENVWLINGNWNVVIVKQSNGLVVIECPQSGGYSDRIIALLAKKFPGVPIKAIVSTTDSLWHFAGMRSYVARGIPIYALDLTIPRLQKFISNKRTFMPDDLTRHPLAPIFKPVTTSASIGNGASHMVIYPIRGRGDERMMMVFFPETGLLYGSSNDGVNNQATFNAFEIVARVDALKLPVKNYVAIHTPKTSWENYRQIVLTQPPQDGK